MRETACCHFKCNKDLQNVFCFAQVECLQGPGKKFQVLHVQVGQVLTEGALLHGARKEGQQQVGTVLGG
jgi:hypothetical protein